MPDIFSHIRYALPIGNFTGKRKDFAFRAVTFIADKVGYRYTIDTPIRNRHRFETDSKHILTKYKTFDKITKRWYGWVLLWQPHLYSGNSKAIPLKLYMHSSHKSEFEYTERYRSGHNGTDSKFYGDLVVSSAGNPPFIRVFKIKNRIFFSVLSCFSLQKFFDRNLSEEKSRLKYTHGELSERSKVQHSKTSSQERNKNAEKPLTLRFSGICLSPHYLEF